MRLSQRDRRAPHATTIQPAGPYVAAGAEVARRLGHSVIGTEHVLSALLRDRDGSAVQLLTSLSVGADAVEEELACWLTDESASERIDPRALAELGIDFEAVRERLERTFGPGALERTQSACLGIAPRLKLALAHAVDYAAGHSVDDVHVVLGLLSVPDSVAALTLRRLGVTLTAAETAAGAT